MTTRSTAASGAQETGAVHSAIKVQSRQRNQGGKSEAVVGFRGAAYGMMDVRELSCPGTGYRMAELELKLLVSGVPRKGIVATTGQSSALTVCRKWVVFRGRFLWGT